MYGAIIGDIVGSKHEFNPIKTKDFPFVSEGCEFTDDTVMTVAVAKALLKAGETTAQGNPVPFKQALVSEMQDLGRKYPRAGYGGMFWSWLESANPRPYNSYGNGSAMRVSPCGLMAVTLDEALELARASAEVTHNHPEGIKGAQATAGAVFLAKTGEGKDAIRAFVEDGFYGPLPSVDAIRPRYSFDVTCQGSVPEAIACFLESTGYEDTVRNAVSLGGDADTQGAIAGAIAWSYYRLGQGRSESAQPCERIVQDYRIDELLPAEFTAVIGEFEAQRTQRCQTFDETGGYTPIAL